jgi:upstream activation factor subunit UAF30
MPTAKKRVAKPAKKKTAAKKPAKKATTKKAPAKKKAAPKKTTAKKAPAKKKAAAKKTTAKKAPAKKKTVKAKTKRKPNPAFMRPMTPSPELGAIVGSSPLPRTEVTKKVWVYIKKHGLQDATNRRMINADANLKKVFGGKNQVNMFEMTKLVNKHLK